MIGHHRLQARAGRHRDVDIRRRPVDHPDLDLPGIETLEPDGATAPPRTPREQHGLTAAARSEARHRDGLAITDYGQCHVNLQIRR
jgi:hypothetical protein